jgi:hypothetical protein
MKAGYSLRFDNTANLYRYGIYKTCLCAYFQLLSCFSNLSFFLHQLVIHPHFVQPHVAVQPEPK